MFDGWRRERKIRKVLAGIARQRVALVLQPHNTWVLEHALKRNDDVEAALATCLMRGWVEALHENMPVGDLDARGLPSSQQPFTRTETTYRLTEGGWAALNRAHIWTVVGVAIALLTLAVTLLTVV